MQFINRQIHLSHLLLLLTKLLSWIIHNDLKFVSALSHLIKYGLVLVTQLALLLNFMINPLNILLMLLFQIIKSLQQVPVLFLCITQSLCQLLAYHCLFVWLLLGTTLLLLVGIISHLELSIEAVQLRLQIGDLLEGIWMNLLQLRILMLKRLLSLFHLGRMLGLQLIQSLLITLPQLRFNCFGMLLKLRIFNQQLFILEG